MEKKNASSNGKKMRISTRLINKIGSLHVQEPSPQSGCQMASFHTETLHAIIVFPARLFSFSNFSCSSADLLIFFFHGHIFITAKDVLSSSCIATDKRSSGTALLNGSKPCGQLYAHPH